MAFTEEQLAAQQKMIEELKDELSRLNSVFDARMKDAGLTPADLEGLSLENAPPEVKQMLAQAREAAKRAGEARAAQTPQPASSAPAGAGPSRRRNVIRF
jgi:peptidoglycan hydrolase CwlO-like protein